MADEAGFLELLVANERVGRWLDILMDPYQRSRHQHAIAELHQDLQKGSAYVEEATRMGAVQVLTKLLSQTPAENLKASDIAVIMAVKQLKVVTASLRDRGAGALLHSVNVVKLIWGSAAAGCEEVMDRISRIIRLCSGPMACGGQVCSFRYGSVRVLIREGSLGDGLGAKVWSVCHIMCRELVAHPDIFQDQVVLELGSGTGLVGLVAALAGAQQVILSDHEPEVLLNLRTCMHMNTTAGRDLELQQQQQGSFPCHHQQSSVHGEQDAAVAATAAQPTAVRHHQQYIPADAELFDDAESTDDLEMDLSALMLDEAAAASKPGGWHDSNQQVAKAAVVASKLTAWDTGNISVRLLDWQESADALATAGAVCGTTGSFADPNGLMDTDDAIDGHRHTADCNADDRAPPVPMHQKFSVILGNEVMYETLHAQLVAAAIKHRLHLGGRALLCCAVRDQKVFDEFRDSCRQWGLRYRTVQVQPSMSEDLGGIQGRERDYEGGYLLMAVDHAAAPAQDWHRHDFADVA